MGNAAWLTTRCRASRRRRYSPSNGGTRAKSGDQAHDSVCIFLRQLAPPRAGSSEHLPIDGAYLRIETEKLRQRGVQLQIIGLRDRLPKLLLREIERAEFLIAEGECLHLQIAVDYSSREAIIRAIGAFSQRLSQEPESSVDSRQNLLSSALSSENGDVDLLIRTGGQKRLSDFLLWESAYAELFFTERMWPDFDTSELDAAVADFRRRERRFGGVPTTVPHSIAPNVEPTGH